MENFEDVKKGNLLIGVNYLELKKDFDIIKESMKRIYESLDNAAIKRMHYRPERRAGEERRKECSNNEQ